MSKLFWAWRTFQESFLQYVAALLLLGMTLLAVLEVIRRYVFGVSFEWQQDAVTYGILSGVFLFFTITQSRKAHLRVTVLLLVLRKKGGRPGSIMATVLEIFGAAVGIAFCVWLVWHGYEVLQLMISQGRKTESLLFPLWLFFAVYLAGMAFLAVSFFFQLIHEIQVLRGKEPPVDRYEEEREGGSLL